MRLASDRDSTHVCRRDNRHSLAHMSGQCEPKNLRMSAVPVKTQASPLSARRWPVRAGFRTKTNGNTIPSVDGCNRQREVDELLFAELPARLFVQLVRDMMLGDQGQLFGPCQCRALAFAVIGRFAPCGQAVETLLALAGGARVFSVHIDAICAAIDLRGAQLD